MLTAVKAPLKCFGLSYAKSDPTCRSCPHAAECQDYMGTRLDRIVVGETKFDLVPPGYKAVRHLEERDIIRRDIEAIYCRCYRQVFGGDSPAPGYVGRYSEKLIKLAETCKVPVPMFMLISMFGHYAAYPTTPFSPATLVDGRAANRVNTYADACKQKFGAVNALLLDLITGDDMDVYDLEKRMRDSEAKVGRWIIDYKLYHQGQPFEPLFDDLETFLDPCWLAIEPRYERRLMLYSTRSVNPKISEQKDTQHQALKVYARLKKHRYEAICHYQTRENAMPKAVELVLNEYGYGPNDFEIEDKAITDPLQFWNRLAIALQHMECLLFVNYREGIYAST